ncbi:MAG: DUF4287 domain-containing protein [Planctomycetes bacterium]|nr:DUF4287 domain-containing protein [Planctomycetota bacterium]
MAKKKSLFGVHPGVEMVVKWIDDLPAKTGHSLDEWLKIINRDGPAGEAERRDWLKKEHGFGTNGARWVAERSVGKGGEEDTPQDYLQHAEVYVKEMFAGKKVGLKPIFDALLELGLKQGKDVKACPCKTIVPLYRNHVFAQIKPTTATRIDFGFALRDTKAKGRLIDTGGFAKKDRITHRIPIARVEEIDVEVKKWLQAAYDMDA